MSASANHLRDGSGIASIRRARVEDADDISVVLRDAFGPYESLYTPEGFAASSASADRVRARLLEGPIWVAEVDDTIAGTVAAVLVGRGLYVRGMAVARYAQGHHITDRLLDEVEGFAYANGVTLLELRTTPFLTTARRLYERHGFRLVPCDRTLYGTPLIGMEKALAARA